MPVPPGGDAEHGTQPSRSASRPRSVPPPVPPDDGAWYAPRVCAQYEVHGGVVVTIRERSDGFAYVVREPALTPAGRRAAERIDAHFEGADLRRPLTREGAAECMSAGFEPKYERAIDRLVSVSPATRRRVVYHALADLRCLGRLTPPALDGDVELADVGGDGLVVHTTDYAPATIVVGGTGSSGDADGADGANGREAVGPDGASGREADGAPGREADGADGASGRGGEIAGDEYVERFASERVARYRVGFHEFSVPVVLYRERVLGSDPFETKYAVLEPDLLPGDESLIAECKERVWETSVGGVIEVMDSFSVQPS